MAIKISDFFDKITEKYCPCLTTKVHKSEYLKDFYSDCVKNTLPDVEVVMAWHKLLKDYIKDPDAVFFIRRYASSKDKVSSEDKKSWDIRRGFLTVYNNIKLVYVDNYFAQYFYAMAINKFVPEYDDFKQFVLNREIPYGHRDDSKERPHQAYKKGDNYPLNKNGWKLSHVFSANQNDYNFDYRSVVNDLFPKGEYDQFVKHDSSDYPYRKIDEDVSDDNIKRIKAHFLRVVHPINYFLTPMGKNQSSCLGIKDIGEDPYMIAYMKDILKKRYKDIFPEYLDMIMARTNGTPLGLKYGMGLSKQGSIGTAPSSDKSTGMSGSRKDDFAPYTNKQVADSIRAYLFDGRSLRDIEQSYLRVSKNGNSALGILKKNGI